MIAPLHLVATGSADGAVRLWDPTQAAPFAVLHAPAAPAVLDVVVVAADEIVLAYCNNCVSFQSQSQYRLFSLGMFTYTYERQDIHNTNCTQKTTGRGGAK
jgi:hypothetical protein